MGREPSPKKRGEKGNTVSFNPHPKKKGHRASTKTIGWRAAFLAVAAFLVGQIVHKTAYWGSIKMGSPPQEFKAGLRVGGERGVGGGRGGAWMGASEYVLKVLA